VTYFITGDIRCALHDYLTGNGESPLALSRAKFEAWADAVELPFAQVARIRTSEDGIFVLPDAEGWLVMEQARGLPLPGAQIHASYRAAKRAALGLALPVILGMR
jgi:hypothetical protein